MKKKLHPFPVPPRDGSTLWYLSPAPDSYQGWENAALPIGNGAIGAKIFGGIAREHIQFNEKSLWSGGPGVPGNTGGNSKCDKGASLKAIQQLLAKQEYAAATQKMKELQGNETGLGAYQNFGDFYLEFDGVAPENAQDYIRDLNLGSATASVSYRHEGSSVLRQYFVSYPHNVLVCKVSTDSPKGLTFTLKAESAQHGQISAEGNALEMSGTVTEWLGGQPGPSANSLRWAAKFVVAETDGVVTAGEEALTISGAKETLILLTAATDYKNEYPLYRSGKKPMNTVEETLKKAEACSYDELYRAHVEDYRALFDRMQLHVGEAPSNLPTDELLGQYKKGKASAALEMLYFQYSRYLLISSSRIGSLPANLQGIWNAKNDPPWQSDYHLNVNMQMIYWPSMVTNLKETAPPMVEYVNSLREPGRVTAYSYVGVGTEKKDGSVDTSAPTGWMAHTQNNIFGNTGPGSDWRWGWAPTAGAWMTQNMYEYYTFTMELPYLKDNIYPAMEECALMWSQLLTPDSTTGRLVSSPCFSPENGPVSAGNTFDQELIWQLYQNTIEAAKALSRGGFGDCVNEPLIETLKAQQPRLRPLEVGKWGQIKEWPQEDTWKDRGFRSNGVQKNHRHMSHLLGVFPGNHVTPDTSEFFEAAKVSVADRQNIPWHKKWNPMLDTGWSKAQKLCSWARLREGNRSYHTFSQLLKHSTLDNLWDTHPPFQLDGNMGACAGIAEMLVQSHTGVIDLLPALPDAWSAGGSVKGICARGGFVLDFQWKNGILTSFTIHATQSGMCRVRNPSLKTASIKTRSEERVPLEQSGDSVLAFPVQQGETYFIQF